MPNTILIQHATIVNEGRIFIGTVRIDGDRIAAVVDESHAPSPALGAPADAQIINAEGLLLMPGVIDTHVHFRDGGLHDNPAGTFHSESRAARAGGVTSVIDMPNTNPQTTGLAELEAKEAMAAADSAVNYGFMLGATNSNIPTLLAIDPTRYAAIKLFLGSSTGNMLVNASEPLEQLFSQTRKLIVAHCEEEAIVQANMLNYKREYQGTDGETAALHPKIRNSEACFTSTYHAIERARRHGTRLHIAHISTATELSLLSNFDLKDKHITAEVTPNHLFFDDRDYAALGNLIKCNPAIKSADDRLALWAALEDGLIDTIATDHAPHPLEAKRRPYFDAPSGIPSIQHSLQMMLEVALFPDTDVADGLRIDLMPLHERLLHAAFPITTVVQKMCHAPADLFGLRDRGYIRPGFKADLVLVNPAADVEVTRPSLLYRCGWSPLEGQHFHSQVVRVWVNGQEEGGAEALQYSC